VNYVNSFQSCVTIFLLETLTFLRFFHLSNKTIVFGFTIGIVGTYKGFYATQGTRGVGKAANQAVVVAMFLIFMEEMIIVQIANWIRYL
jgi:phospholipid/cholesterol/gamma-HCH transport system permease protein